MNGSGRPGERSGRWSSGSSSTPRLLSGRPRAYSGVSACCSSGSIGSRRHVRSGRRHRSRPVRSRSARPRLRGVSSRSDRPSGRFTAVRPVSPTNSRFRTLEASRARPTSSVPRWSGSTSSRTTGRSGSRTRVSTFTSPRDANGAKPAKVTSPPTRSSGGSNATGRFRNRAPATSAPTGRRISAPATGFTHTEPSIPTNPGRARVQNPSF